ncbi:hypothetical protein DFH07DRAFT_783761 [Mycena maculata]|uniref:Uncharacterized protein n=1 Tax=Mycena maculata TaxID=230809 RepID=A0AAD7MLI4_9AGAR|nr:hypothetical protein DFH07DRAFT_783761 [Mycena maculata]
MNKPPWLLASAGGARFVRDASGRIRSYGNFIAVPPARGLVATKPCREQEKRREGSDYVNRPRISLDERAQYSSDCTRNRRCHFRSLWTEVHTVKAKQGSMTIARDVLVQIQMTCDSQRFNELDDPGARFSSCKVSGQPGHWCWKAQPQHFSIIATTDCDRLALEIKFHVDEVLHAGTRSKLEINEFVLVKSPWKHRYVVKSNWHQTANQAPDQDHDSLPTLLTPDASILELGTSTGEKVGNKVNDTIYSYSTAP